MKGTVFFRQVKSRFWLCENGHFWCKTAPVRKLLSLYFTVHKADNDSYLQELEAMYLEIL